MLLVPFLLAHLIANPVPHPSRPAVAPPIDSTEAWFQFFRGNWHCAGGFPNGRKLEAEIAFVADLGGRWLQYRHSDVAPGTYRVGGLWGHQGKDSTVVTLLHDNGGGIRFYRSAGWIDSALVFVKDTAFRPAGTVAGTPDRFTYRKASDSTFWFGWELSRAGNWIVGDSLTCRRHV